MNSQTQQDAERISMTVSVTTKRKLERLARHRGTTQRAVLEALLADAESVATAALSATNERAYYGGS